jgi:hypothetical protein
MGPWFSNRAEDSPGDHVPEPMSESETRMLLRAGHGRIAANSCCALVSVNPSLLFVCVYLCHLWALLGEAG